jgi:hypothetical protein
VLMRLMKIHGQEREEIVTRDGHMAGRAACLLRSVAISAMVIRERQKATFPVGKGGVCWRA